MSCNRAALKPDTVDRLVFLAKKNSKSVTICVHLLEVEYFCLHFAYLIYLLKPDTVNSLFFLAKKIDLKVLQIVCTR